MYRYDEFDQRQIDERVAQFRGQISRWKQGVLSDDELRPLRLQNGLYIQRHAPMLRVAIPYGELSAPQLRVMADVADRWDRGYAHFTTRQNIQYNWFAIEDAPEMLGALAKVQVHAIQTSGNCVRNITTDHLAGVARDERVDPRPYCEIMRQWSTFHPEFAHLPRKFKIAFNGAREDRAATAVHDIGIYLNRDASGEVVLDVLVGGGLGRTPVIGTIIKRALPRAEMLNYVEAILRVYNLHGRRDNKYKARIKILVRALGAEEFARQVDAEWAIVRSGEHTLTQQEYLRVERFFEPPPFESLRDEALSTEGAFGRWIGRNVHEHRVPGYAAVTISLKSPSRAPGDATSAQMRAIAELAEQFSFGELRVTHLQNLVLPFVRQRDLAALWEALKSAGLATPTIGLLSDIVACPGGDYCSLANAKSIPIAQAVQERFDDLDYLHDIGEISFNISGCINSCGHHHVGNIGVLGVDKQGEEWYQITLGGTPGETPDSTRIGQVIGPSFSAHEVPDVVKRLIDTYLAKRDEGERFIDTFERLGLPVFKEAAYDKAGSEEVAHA